MKRNLLLISTLLFSISLMAQVSNEVSVFVRPGTEVHIFENMTNESTGTVTVGNGGLLYVDGTLVNNGSMTFNNASSLLRGSTGSDGTGSGTYYVKRQGTTNGSIYQYWSSPMVSYSGVPGNATFLYNSNTSTQDFADDLDPDPGWIAHNGAMTPGQAYAGRGAGLVTFNGDVNNGNVNVPLTFYPYAPTNTNPGTPFNLCGNPYPSAISCASLVAANTDVNGSIYFWDDDLSGGSGYSSSDYAVWNGTGSLGTGSGIAGAPNGYISTGQGFMIRALNGSAVLNFTNNMRVANNNTQFFRPNGDDSRLWFSIEGNTHFNQILIGILTDATDNEDRLYDAVKIRGNTNISLAAINDDRDYAIMAFPPPASQKTIPLSVFISETGLYTFRASTMENFEYQNVYFFDARTSQQVQLHEGTEISIPLGEGLHDGRFYLNFYPDGFVGIPEENISSVLIYASQNLLYLSATENQSNVSLQMFDLGGRKVLQQNGINLTSESATIPLSNLTDGIYLVRLLTDSGYINQKVLKQ